MDSEVSGVNMIKDEEPEEMEVADNAQETESASELETEAEMETEVAEETAESEIDEAVVSNVTPLPQGGVQHLRMLEAMLFATTRPVSTKELAERLPKGVDVEVLLTELAEVYDKRGVVLEKVADKWTFRTAADLNYLFQKEAVEPKRLSKAGIETLAIIAYHQPVTRAEIENIRGVTVSKGTVDLLLDVGWIRLRGRRRTPGRPITYGTTEDFLEHFGLEGVTDLPGLEDLKAAGLLDANLPPSFAVPDPDDQISDEEDPLEDEAEADLLDALEDDDEAEVEEVMEASEDDAPVDEASMEDDLTEEEITEEDFVEVVEPMAENPDSDEIIEEDDEETRD